jgi:hypothetical protein
MDTKSGRHASLNLKEATNETTNRDHGGDAAGGVVVLGANEIT